MKSRRIYLFLALLLGLTLAAGMAIIWAGTTSPPSSTPSPTVTASPTPTPTPTPKPTPTPTPTPSPTPTPDPYAAWENQRLTFLVGGIDRNAARAASGTLNTDSLMVVSISANHRAVDMISLPRDIVDVPLGNGTIWTGKINAIAASLGFPALRLAISSLLEVPLDGYVFIDMDDFAEVVDAIGGVDVIVPEAINDAHLGLNVAAGAQHFDGHTALSYSRSRYTTSDYSRADRQQLLLLAIVERLTEGDMNIDPLALVRSLSSLQTDLALAAVPALTRVAADIDDKANIERLVFDERFATFVGLAGERGWIYAPNLVAMRAAVANMLAQ